MLSEKCPYCMIPLIEHSLYDKIIEVENKLMGRRELRIAIKWHQEVYNQESVIQQSYNLESEDR